MQTPFILPRDLYDPERKSRETGDTTRPKETETLLPIPSTIPRIARCAIVSLAPVLHEQRYKVCIASLPH